MKPVLTADEYRRVENAHEGDLADAMERAGHAVHLAAVRAGADYGKRVAVLAGRGNNGGDGYVAARHLAARGAHVVVHALGQPRTDLAIDAARRMRESGVPVVGIGRPDGEDLVIDALFGGGARGGLPEEVTPWLDTGSPVVSVDFPSGLDPNTGRVADRAFRADETVTFGAMKTGHVLGAGPDHCGVVTVADIGITGGSPSLYIAEESDTIRPPRRRRTHKWDAGAVAVVGGSSGMTGAAVLTGRGALGFGAGSVVIASPDREAVAANTVEFPTLGLDDAIAAIDRFDVVVFGPGLADEDFDLAFPILQKSRRAVIDAGGLTPRVAEFLETGEVDVVLTPHSGEFERVAGRPGGTYAVRAFARKLGGTVLLKGNPTRISDGGPPVLVDTGGPELATIGTGDVLSGMIAALMARGAPTPRAAITAAYFHGLAGSDVAMSGPLTASLLADQVRRYAW